ncbi:unnamed protein product [Polarella glacialis]|uniref:Uncharacterized protein n=1 Tax=Polarella glacialis TaxID=89957 RepID=A0A813FJ41_POLGL|nr:unnamed protein product [Polarella glacialis]
MRPVGMRLAITEWSVMLLFMLLWLLLSLLLLLLLFFFFFLFLCLLLFLFLLLLSLCCYVVMLLYSCRASGDCGASATLVETISIPTADANASVDSGTSLVSKACTASVTFGFHTDE